MAADESIPTLKILMIGPSGAGKSALLIRYCDDPFDSESSTATIGVDFKIKKLSVHGKAYRLNLLDTAGQERFRTLSNSYYRGAHGVILVYDISNRDSFLAMERWFEEVDSNAQPGAVTYLVGAKMDKISQRTVKVEEGQKMAEERGCVGFCEVSSKKGENVRKPFVEIVDAVVKKPELLSSGTRRMGTVAVSGSDEGFGSGCSC